MLRPEEIRPVLGKDMSDNREGLLLFLRQSDPQREVVGGMVRGKQTIGNIGMSQHRPQFRKKAANKKALVIASAAAPALVSRLFYSTMKQLKDTAKTIGADSTGLYIGLAAGAPHTRLGTADANRIERATARLL